MRSFAFESRSERKNSAVLSGEYSFGNENALPFGVIVVFISPWRLNFSSAYFSVE